MKMMVMCSAGSVRSVGMAHLLKHDYGIDAVAVGYDTNSPKTIGIVAEWADRIIVVQPRYADGIPKSSLHKLVPTELTDIGPDRWLNPLHEELQSIVRKMALELYSRQFLTKG